MKLSSSNFFLLSQCAISAAYQAGQIISNYSDRSVTVKKKQGGNTLASQVVTEVDHLSQDCILQTLLPTCEMFDLALLSEEIPDNRERLEKDYFWCIDPLDGTLPFIQSTPGYSVSIALVARDGNPIIGIIYDIIGIIYDPVEKTLYQAIKGGGAYRNSRPFTLKSTSAISEQALTWVADQSFEQHPLFSTVMMELENIANQIGYAGLTTLLQGGAAMNACWVLEKQPACYFKFPKSQPGGGSLWDFAATACIFQEAGALVSDINGNTLELNRHDSTFMNHQGALYSSHAVLAEKIIKLYDKLKIGGL
jgi:3'(2'), 5'-bisphosphate nucleotidase/myo-inositol-1(or 4)-monophosphatase